jgi:CheY-like chemotaxis protein
MRLAKAELDATAPDFKVLVADDSPIYRKLVEHALAEKQYAVLFAKSGREAIDLFSPVSVLLASKGPRPRISIAKSARQMRLSTPPSARGATALKSQRRRFFKKWYSTLSESGKPSALLYV